MTIPIPGHPSALPLSVIATAVLLQVSPVSGQERVSVGSPPVEFVVPVGWRIAPDSIAQLLDEGLRQISGPNSATVVAVLSRQGATQWTSHPYVLVRAGPGGVPTFAGLEAQLSNANVQLRSSIPDVARSLEPFGATDLEVGAPLFDRDSGILWLRLSVTDPTNGPTLSTTGTVFFASGRVSISHYDSVDTDPDTGLVFVRSLFGGLTRDRLTPHRRIGPPR